MNFARGFWAQAFAQKLRGRRFLMNVARFPESTQQIQQSEGRCIFKHLELKRLAVDPITLAQLEAEIATPAAAGGEHQML